MKKNVAVVSALLFVVGIFAGCSNGFQKSGGKASGVEYGSIRIVNCTEAGSENSSRALDVTEITSATVTVSGQGMSDIVVENVPISEGLGSATVENIPMGKNRVVTVESNVSGVVIRGLVDVENIENDCPVNWLTSKKANIFYYLIKNYSEVDVSSLSASAFDEYIPNVHATLIDAESIASDYASGHLSSSASYVRDYGTVNISASNVDGYKIQITDISSEKVVVSGSSSETKSYALKALPGNWKAKVFNGSGELVETKNIAVASGYESSVTVSYTPGNEVTGKIIVHVPSSLGYSDIWAWSTTSPSVNYTGGTWPGKSMTLNGSNYDYELEYTSSKVIFNDHNKGNTVGTNQTNNLYLTEGEWNYIGGKSGTTDSNGSEISSNFEKLSVAPQFTFDVTNPAIPLPPTVTVNYSNGDEIDVNASITFTVTSENTPLTSGTYAIGTKTGSLSLGKNTISLPSGLSAGQDLTVTASVVNSVGSDSLSITLTTVEQAEPSTPTRLGAFYERCGTSFSIWSPDSSNVKVAVKKVGETDFTEHTCTKGFTVDGGYSDSSNIYGVTLKGDYNLAEYQFYIGGKAVRDPYGKMVKYDGNSQKTNKIADGTENGFSYTSYAGPSVNIVMDMDSTEPVGGWVTRPVLENRCDSIVYEVHVSDFTSDSTWGGSASNAGKFPGMVEEGTAYGTTKTGLDHLKELGITHIQILPMYDFATKYNNTLNDIYNWGYDPVNYNVPEDRYSTCPGDYIERVREVKNMINEFHRNGIRVIMDVVYNHTFAKEMFKDISGKYYTTTDLSGCGNSVNTGVDMVSRFIRDSLEYWVEEYNIDGFRFDLLGIYHTSAVKSWGEYLNNTKFPDRMLLMYGEPWNGYATDSEESAKVRMSAVSSMGNAHVGVFNGKYRQSLKGANDTAKMGYIFNANEDDGTAYAANIAVGLKGSGVNLDKSNCSDTSGTWTRFFTQTPDQSINYMYAHDNLCYWDKIKAAGKTGDYAKRIVKFGHGILLVSQGIPFIHAGDDFLRTKEKGAGSAMSHNSYMAGIETNAIDWSLKATNSSIFKYHADLIALRKAHDGLRYRNGVGTTETTGNAVKYYVQDTDGTKLCIVVNPGDNIDKPVSGATIFDIHGSNPSSTKCEGTAVTIIRY